MVVPIRNIQCGNCKHVHKGGPPPTCAAFPSEIPDAILTGDHDHTKPYRGDHGIRWEAAAEGAKQFEPVQGIGDPLPAGEALEVAFSPEDVEQAHALWDLAVPPVGARLTEAHKASPAEEREILEGSEI